MVVCVSIKNYVIDDGDIVFFEGFRVNRRELSLSEMFGNSRICDSILIKKGNKFVIDGVMRKSIDGEKHAD
jgi:hypothetical protein